MVAVFGDCAAARPPAPMPSSAATKTMKLRTVPTSPLLRADNVVFEITGGVGLRPQPDFAIHRRLQHRVVLHEQIRTRWRAVAPRPWRTAEDVGQDLRAVERAGDVRAVDIEAQFVPLLAIARRLQQVAVARPDQRPPDAVVELPENDVV